MIKYILLASLFLKAICYAEGKFVLNKEQRIVEEYSAGVMQHTHGKVVLSTERQIIDEYSAELKKEKKICRRLYGMEWAGPDKIYNGKIHKIVLGFSIDANYQREEAKQIFFGLVDELINKINQNLELKDNFQRFPIEYQDFYFHLSFDYEDKGHLKKGDVDSISIFENKLLIHEVENEKKPQMKTEEVSPEIFILKGFESNTKCIREPLPIKPASKIKMDQ
jgi:hypothetical protein